MLRQVVVTTGAILLGSGVIGGYCVYGLASFLYYAIYPPVELLTLDFAERTDRVFSDPQFVKCVLWFPSGCCYK